MLDIPQPIAINGKDVTAIRMGMPNVIKKGWFQVESVILLTPAMSQSLNASHPT